ncbi:MAG: Clp protease N-terminal domain-containing protein [Solirubrobacteraceae bacterium]
MRAGCSRRVGAIYGRGARGGLPGYRGGQRVGHHGAGVEHVLLGLVGEHEASGSGVLREFGVDAAAVFAAGQIRESARLIPANPDRGFT